MSQRKHISWKKKYACALLALRDIPYGHAREMTADQMISLYHVDHNILHETENENVDQWWNLTPRLISAHRVKTKADAKIIAKSRRLRAKYMPSDLTEKGLMEIVKRLPRMKITAEPKISPVSDFVERWEEYQRTKPKQKIKSRGFDKTLRKKLSGKVERR